MSGRRFAIRQFESAQVARNGHSRQIASYDARSDRLVMLSDGERLSQFHVHCELEGQVDFGVVAWHQNASLLVGHVDPCATAPCPAEDLLNEPMRNGSLPTALSRCDQIQVGFEAIVQRH